MTEEMYFYM